MLQWFYTFYIRIKLFELPFVLCSVILESLKVEGDKVSLIKLLVKIWTNMTFADLALRNVNV